MVLLSEVCLRCILLLFPVDFSFSINFDDLNS